MSIAAISWWRQSICPARQLVLRRYEQDLSSCDAGQAPGGLGTDCLLGEVNNSTSHQFEAFFSAGKSHDINKFANIRSVKVNELHCSR